MDQEQPVSLFEFMLNRHKELEEKAILHYNNDNIQLGEINKAMSEYVGNRSWAITEYRLAEQSYKIAKIDYDFWEESKITQVRRILKDLDPKAKEFPRWVVDAKISELYQDEKKKLKKELSDLEVRLGYFKDIKETWVDQKDIMQTLSNNIRKDMDQFDSVKRQNGTPALERMKQDLENKKL